MTVRSEGCRVWGLAVALTLASTVAWAQAAGIPVRFHGEWNGDLGRCGDREAGGGLTIGADFITYFEAGDAVLRVNPAELGGVNILVDHVEDGVADRLSRTLILSDDGQTLSFTYGDGPEDVVRRCPQGNSDGR